MSERKLWSPGVAAVLSLVIPGAGQIYKGQVFNGLLWLVVVVAGYDNAYCAGHHSSITCILGATAGKNTAPDPNAPNPDTTSNVQRLSRAGTEGRNARTLRLRPRPSVKY